MWTSGFVLEPKLGVFPLDDYLYGDLGYAVHSRWYCIVGSMEKPLKVNPNMHLHKDYNFYMHMN